MDRPFSGLTVMEVAGRLMAEGNNELPPPNGEVSERFF
jgi:hypothetical protein